MRYRFTLKYYYVILAVFITYQLIECNSDNNNQFIYGHFEKNNSSQLNITYSIYPFQSDGMLLYVYSKKETLELIMDWINEIIKFRLIINKNLYVYSIPIFQLCGCSSCTFKNITFSVKLNLVMESVKVRCNNRKILFITEEKSVMFGAPLLPQKYSGWKSRVMHIVLGQLFDNKRVLKACLNMFSINNKQINFKSVKLNGTLFEDTKPNCGQVCDTSKCNTGKCYNDLSVKSKYSCDCTYSLRNGAVCGDALTTVHQNQYIYLNISIVTSNYCLKLSWDSSNINEKLIQIIYKNVNIILETRPNQICFSSKYSSGCNDTTLNMIFIEISSNQLNIFIQYYNKTVLLTIIKIESNNHVNNVDVASMHISSLILNNCNYSMDFYGLIGIAYRRGEEWITMDIPLYNAIAIHPLFNRTGKCGISTTQIPRQMETTDSKDKSTTVSLSLMILCNACGLLSILLVVLVIYLCKRKKKQQKGSHEPSFSRTLYRQSCTPDYIGDQIISITDSTYDMASDVYVN